MKRIARGVCPLFATVAGVSDSKARIRPARDPRHIIAPGKSGTA